MTDALTGEPIPGATVQIVDSRAASRTATTNASGGYTASSADGGIAAGPVTVTVSYAGYCRSESGANLSKGVPNTYNVALQPAQVTGVVTDKGTSVPLVNATVTMTDTLSRVFTTQTVAGGVYTFTNSLANPFSVAEVQLSAAKEGYSPAVESLTLTACGPNSRNLALGTVDLLVLKSDGAAQVAPGELLTYTITVENRGSAAAEGVRITDTLRSAPYLIFVDATPGYTPVLTNYVWALAQPLAVGETATLTLTARVATTLPDGDTILENYVHATAASPEADITNNENSDFSAATAHPNLTVFKSAIGSTSPIQANETITYTLVGQNLGRAIATGVVISDQLDSLTTYIPGSAQLTVGGASQAVTVTATSPVLVMELPPMPPGVEGALNYRVQVAGSLPPGLPAIHNRVSVALNEVDADPSNNSSAADVPIQAGVDLYIDKVAQPDPAPAQPGGRIYYTLRYGNRGSTTATNVTLTDTLPANVAIEPGSVYRDGAPQPDPSGYPAIPLLSGATLAARSDHAITFTAIISDALPAGALTLTNTAVITCAEGDLTPASNESSAVTPVVGYPNLSVAKDDAVIQVLSGAEVTYTLTVRNDGNRGASGVVVTDTLAEGLSFVSGSASDGGVYDPAHQAVVWNLGDLPAGEPRTLTYRAQVAPTTRAEALTSNRVVVADDGMNGIDPDLENNRAVDNDHVVRPYLVLKKAVSGPAGVGELITYTLSYHNASPETAYGVVLSDTLPANTAFVSASAGGALAGGAVSWPIGDVAPDAGGNVELVVRLLALNEEDEPLPDSLARQPALARETITSTLIDVASPWFAGPGASAPSLRLRFQGADSVGQAGWRDNPRAPSEYTFDSWIAPVAAGLESYWYPESDLQAQWVAHDPAGQAAPNYTFFRHRFYLPLNAVSPVGVLQLAGDDKTEIYINDMYLGSEYGGGGATTFTDTVGLQGGENLLAVRLLNNDHGGHHAYIDPYGVWMCHPGLLYNLAIDYALRPFAAAPAVARAGEAITVTVNEDAVGGVAPYTVLYDFGDGSPASGVATHVYTQTGVFTTTVTAQDAEGCIARDALPITVMPAYSSLVINHAQAAYADARGAQYHATSGVANTAFLGLEPVIGVDKRQTAIHTDLSGATWITYTISISTTGSTLDVVPLLEEYDPAALTYARAFPEPDAAPYPGRLTWNDLTVSGAHGLGRNLEEAQPFDVLAVFEVNAEGSGVTTNTVAVAGALDEQGYAVNEARDSATLDLDSLDLAVSAPLAWHDPACAGWRQRYTLSFRNTSDETLTNVVMASELPLSTSGAALLDESSPGALYDGADRVWWPIGAVAPGQEVVRYLEVRLWSSLPAGAVITNCLTVSAEGYVPQSQCSAVAIAQCAGPSPTAWPTTTPSATPSATPSHTPTPDVTPTPSPTGPPTVAPPPLYLPLVLRMGQP